jgi:transposase
MRSASPSSSSLTNIGVGIDTARYGHRVSFLYPDRQPAAKPLTVLENQDGYTALRNRLQQLHQQHPQAHFHVRVDAAGQYAMNLESYLRSLALPMTISIGEPKRNKDYQKAHFPKRTTDDTESQAMARFAVVEQPKATPASPAAMDLLREVAGRLQAQVKQSTQAINRLHNLLARVFPELATLTKDIAAGWVLHLLDKYPTAPRIAQARLSSMENIPYLPQDKARAIHQAAQRSVGSLQGEVAEELVRELVAQLRHCQVAEHKLRQLLLSAHAALPCSGHAHLTSIPGVGAATAAVLTAKMAGFRQAGVGVGEELAQLILRRLAVTHLSHQFLDERFGQFAAQGAHGALGGIVKRCYLGLGNERDLLQRSAPSLGDSFRRRILAQKFQDPGGGEVVGERGQFGKDAGQEIVQAIDGLGRLLGLGLQTAGDFAEQHQLVGHGWRGVGLLNDREACHGVAFRSVGGTLGEMGLLVILVAFGFADGNSHGPRQATHKAFEIAGVLAGSVDTDMEVCVGMLLVELFKALSPSRFSWMVMVLAAGCRSGLRNETQ